MRRPNHTVAVAGVLLVLSLGASILLLRKIDRLRTHATLQETIYIRSPKVLKRLSLGYDGLLADIYWTRAVQYFGGGHASGATNFSLLGPLLQIATTLDPKLTVAYDYGANFLSAPRPNGAGDPQAAVDLVRTGIKNNPDNWHLYYNLGFIYYIELKDYASAADAFARGSKLPDAHPFMTLLAGRMAEHAGDIQMARMMWATSYETTTNKSVRANAAAHLRALQVDDDVQKLQELVNRYSAKMGQKPTSFTDLITIGMLRGMPRDPLGNPYKIAPGGLVEVRDPDSLPFIEKGVPPNYVPPERPRILPSD